MAYHTPVYMHPHSTLHFIFCLAMICDCQLMLCSDNNQTTSQKYVRNLRDIKEVHEHAREHLRAAQKRQKNHYDQRIAEEQIKVHDQVFLRDPAVKKGQTNKLHSPWQGPYILITRIGNVTYHIQAVNNPRKRKVVHFNPLKLCGVPNPVDQ